VNTHRGKGQYVISENHITGAKKYTFNLGVNPWSLGAVVIAFIVLTPILAVFYMAFFPTENIWPHLLNTTLPRYLTTTLALMTSVGVGAAFIGAGAAWIVTRYTFWGARWFEWLLLMPLAIPAYLGAYALVDLLEYAGPVQTTLRYYMGWNTARDYWFPEIRSFGAAVIVLTFAMYPYVYLLSRSAFREQSAAAEEVAQSLGMNPLMRFLRIGLPLARPAIAAGVAIVMMETVNDFGTVDYFSVQTLTTGIFSVWLQSNNAGGAAQIASVILMLIVVLVTLEKIGRNKMRFFALSTRHRAIEKKELNGMSAILAIILCGLPILFGFVVPTFVLGHHALNHMSEWVNPDLTVAVRNTLMTGIIAALVTVLSAGFMVYGVRLSGHRLPRMLQPITTIGYAAPGAVLAVGILIPLAAFDNMMADMIEGAFGIDLGLVLTGSAFALVFSYCVRFFAIAQGAADAAMGRISPNLSNAARSLGRTHLQVLREIYFPLLKGSFGSALLLVFVDCVKELPATLLLRPFNFNTLATRVHDQASLENLSQAAPAALMMILVGVAAVGLLARTNK
jgi:iron(III) transport system permease protein